jgi:hypothetical protein
MWTLVTAAFRKDVDVILICNPAVLNTAQPWWCVQTSCYFHSRIRTLNPTLQLSLGLALHRETLTSMTSAFHLTQFELVHEHTVSSFMFFWPWWHNGYSAFEFLPYSSIVIYAKTPGRLALSINIWGKRNSLTMVKLDWLTGVVSVASIFSNYFNGLPSCFTFLQFADVWSC